MMIGTKIGSTGGTPIPSRVREMAQGRHSGCVVRQMTDEERARVESVEYAAKLVRDNRKWAQR